MKNPVNDVNTSYFSEAELRVVKLLANIKQYGLEVILVLVNICTYTDLKSL
jgi:hypothetical protein